MTDKNLYQRLLDVRRAVTGVKKDATNQYHKFRYASSATVLAAVRQAMDDAGVLLIPDITAHSTEEKTTRKGDIEILTHLDIVYTWVNCDNPAETLPVNMYGQGIDAGEKGVGKALTYAEKYFILKFFQIPTSDSFEEDPDAAETLPKQQSQARPQGQMSEKQRKFIWSLAKELSEKPLDYLGDHLGTDNPQDHLKSMSPSAASDLIKQLQDIIEARQIK